MTLSVSITTFNGVPLVRECVASVTWADEIIVVDSGSTDGTREICASLGAKVTQTPDFPGFGQQKNRALDRTTGDWVLALDHDETVSPELRAEIEATIKNPGDAVAFTMPRLSNFCGRDMRHCGWWPDPVTRLFRRGHVNRFLRRLEFAGGEAPSPGAVILAGDREVGSITSATAGHALGFVRREVEPGAEVTVLGLPATVHHRR
mgnify:CR=1 FL=1